MTRSMRVLENSMDEVGLLRNAVEAHDIDTFNDQVHIMLDTVAFINFDEMPEDILKQYSEMNHSLGDMREMGKMIKCPIRTCTCTSIRLPSVLTTHTDQLSC